MEYVLNSTLIVRSLEANLLWLMVLLFYQIKYHSLGHGVYTSQFYVKWIIFTLLKKKKETSIK